MANGRLRYMEKKFPKFGLNSSKLLKRRCPRNNFSPAIKNHLGAFFSLMLDFENMVEKFVKFNKIFVRSVIFKPHKVA